MRFSSFGGWEWVRVVTNLNADPCWSLHNNSVLMVEKRNAKLKNETIKILGKAYRHMRLTKAIHNN